MGKKVSTPVPKNAIKPPPPPPPPPPPRGEKKVVIIKCEKYV